MSDTAPVTGLLTIDATADALGVKPWDVVRLLNAGVIESVELVKADSLNRYRQESK